jgi:hypothetical protein
MLPASPGSPSGIVLDRPLSRAMVRPILIAALLALALAPATAAEDQAGFVVSVESPTVKLGEKATIVATISPRNGYRISESYRHRIVNLVAIDGGVDLGDKVVRGAVRDGRVVFRIEVLARTVGDHIVAGVLRFSINNGEQLDIKAAPFEAIVVGTE